MSQIVRRHVRQSMRLHKAFHSMRHSVRVSRRENVGLTGENKTVIKNRVRVFCGSLFKKILKQLQRSTHEWDCAQARRGFWCTDGQAAFGRIGHIALYPYVSVIEINVPPFQADALAASHTSSYHQVQHTSEIQRAVIQRREKGRCCFR